MPWDYLLTIRMTLQPDFCKSSSDAKGRITRYIYDAWGRLMETSYPDGSAETAINCMEPGKRTPDCML